MSHFLTKYLFVLIFLVISGCTTVYETPIGLKDIEATQMDCKIKSIRGHQWCQDHGIESKITCGVISEYYDPICHCWLEVYYIDGWKLVDLLEWTEDGWSVEQYSEYVPYIRFSGNVKLTDIIAGKNYDWISDKSLQSLITGCGVARQPTTFENIVGR